MSDIEARAVSLANKQRRLRLAEQQRRLRLAEQHRRLRHLAQRVVDEARPADAERPLAIIEPHLLRAIRRELARYEPQPSGFFTISADS